MRDLLLFPFFVGGQVLQPMNLRLFQQTELEHTPIAPFSRG